MEEFLKQKPTDPSYYQTPIVQPPRRQFMEIADKMKRLEFVKLEDSFEANKLATACWRKGIKTRQEKQKDGTYKVWRLK